MQQQKLCLKWNNHTINLLSVLENFQSKDILVDVTLSCEGRNIKAHKMVLSACSPYFQNIFLENPCQHPIVIINGMKFEDITAILNFMYKGEVNVSHEGLSSFLQAAEALKVKGLAEVCGEKRGSNSNCQEAEPSEPARPQRTDTPTKKRHRNRKRSFSDSNRSDDEGAPRKHKEINSPEVHELSGDESYTGDMSSNGQPLNSRVPQNVYSRSHQSSSNITADDMEDEYEVEPSKMLEQTLTENANNSTSSDNGLRIERIVGNAPEMESSSLQEPESPPDIKPIIEFGETSAGPSEGSMLVYNEQSQPGPSNIQDPSLLHDNSHTQGKIKSRQPKKNNNFNAKKKKEGKKKIYDCSQCSFSSTERIIFFKHLNTHRACHHTIKTEKKNHNNQNEEKDPSSSRIYSCFDCIYKTVSIPDIANHLLSHVNSIDVCNKSKKVHAIKTCEKHATCNENEERANSNVINQDPPDLTCSAFGNPQNQEKNSKISKKIIKADKTEIPSKTCKESIASIQGNTSDHNYVFIHKIEKQNETVVSPQNSSENGENQEGAMSSNNLGDIKDVQKQSTMCEKNEIYNCDGCENVFTDLNTLMCHRNYHKDNSFFTSE